MSSWKCYLRIKQHCLWGISHLAKWPTQTMWAQYQGRKQGRIQGGSGGLVPPKIEHLNFWWQPGFYPALYFNFAIINLYFLIFLFLISFLNYIWKMTFLIVYLSLTYIYSVSVMLKFLHFSLIIILSKICFYSFRSSHWEIFYKITTPVLHQCWTN